MWIRPLYKGILPNHYDNSPITADSYEDAKFVFMSGIKTFYNRRYGAHGYVPTEPIHADPSPDATTVAHISLSNKRLYTFADKLVFLSVYDLIYL